MGRPRPQVVDEENGEELQPLIRQKQNPPRDDMAAFVTYYLIIMPTIVSIGMYFFATTSKREAQADKANVESKYQNLWDSTVVDDRTCSTDIGYEYAADQWNNIRDVACNTAAATIHYVMSEQFQEICLPLFEEFCRQLNIDLNIISEENKSVCIATFVFIASIVVGALESTNRLRPSNLFRGLAYGIQNLPQLLGRASENVHNRLATIAPSLILFQPAEDRDDHQVANSNLPSNRFSINRRT